MYFREYTGFLSWLEDRQAAGDPVLNAPSVAIWNLDKSYLRDLHLAGFPVVPSHYMGRQQTHDIQEVRSIAS